MRKNKQWPRYATALLAILLVAASMLTLASCGNTTETTETEGASGTATIPETVPETESPDKTLDVPDVNYNGYTFRVLSVDHDSLYTMLDVEDFTSDAVNTAIYERNRIIEDRFGIQFECEGDDWPNMYNRLSLQVNAGTSGGDAYDLIMLIGREAFQAAVNNLLLPYDRLEYIDTEKEYYFRTLNEMFEIGGHTFFAYGKDNLNVMGQAGSIIFNKEIAKDIHTEDLYALVRDREWTYEKLFTYAEAASGDLNGDGKYELGVDRFGMIGRHDLTIPGFWVCAGEFLIEKDESDMPVANMVGNQRLFDIMQETLAHIDSNAYYINMCDYVGTFMQDGTLFLSTPVCDLYELRAMETDYGVLPFPKYDTAQESYITRSIDGWIHCVPTTCQDSEMTSIIMQAIAYYSDQTVYDAYYNQALSTKFLRDSDSVEMIELMLTSLRVDFGDTIWQSTLRAPMVDRMIQQGSQTGVSSLFTSHQRKAQREIDKLARYLEKQDS